MADPVDAVAAAADALAAAVEGDFNEVINDALPAPAAMPDPDLTENGATLKKRALDMLTEAADQADANGDDLELEATTLDDVMVSPVLKKARVSETGEADEPLRGDEAGGGVVVEEGESQEVDLGDIADDDADALAPPDASTDEDEETRGDHRNGHGNGKVLDVVTLDEEEEDQGDDDELDDEEMKLDEEDEEEDEEDGQLLSPMQRRKIDQNKAEARQLLHQLDSSARSKLVLTALEKYGEDLFDGHETARDGILIDACANDAMLGLMKEAIRVSELYLRGTEDAPLEVDDDEDYGDEEDDEDEDEDEDDEDEEDDEEEATTHQRVVPIDEDVGNDEGTPGEINLLSDEETDDNSSTRATLDVHEPGDFDEGEDEIEDEEDDDTAGTGGELTVESATGDEESVEELSS